MPNTNYIYINTKQKRKIVPSNVIRQDIARYINDVNIIFDKYPELKENQGLLKMIKNEQQAAFSKIVENHVNMVLDLTDRWIGYHRFKKKDVYKRVKKDLGVSEDTFRRLLTKRRTRYALTTRIKVARYFLNRVTFDDFIEDYIRGYQQKQAEISSPLMDFAEAIKLAVEACSSGYEVSKEQQKDYVNSAIKYCEEIEEKIAKCRKAGRKADCMFCKVKSLCEGQK